MATASPSSIRELIHREFEAARKRRKTSPRAQRPPADVDRLVAAIAKLAELPTEQNADATLLVLKTIADGVAALADQPRKWQFDIARDSAGRMTSVTATADDPPPPRDTVAIAELADLEEEEEFDEVYDDDDYEDED